MWEILSRIHSDVFFANIIFFNIIHLFINLFINLLNLFFLIHIIISFMGQGSSVSESSEPSEWMIGGRVTSVINSGESEQQNLSSSELMNQQETRSQVYSVSESSEKSDGQIGGRATSKINSGESEQQNLSDSELMNQQETGGQYIGRVALSTLGAVVTLYSTGDPKKAVEKAKESSDLNMMNPDGTNRKTYNGRIVYANKSEKYGRVAGDPRTNKINES
jgi:hypothetical protein